MKQVEQDVKMTNKETGKQEVVETITINVFENEDDLATLELPVLLSLVNQQHKSNEMNKARAKYRESAPGKGKRYKLGMNCLALVTFSDGQSGLEKLAAIASEFPDPNTRLAEMDKLINSEEVQAEVTKLIGAPE